jgi:hypothetical protein
MKDGERHGVVDVVAHVGIENDPHGPGPLASQAGEEQGSQPSHNFWACSHVTGWFFTAAWRGMWAVSVESAALFLDSLLLHLLFPQVFRLAFSGVFSSSGVAW